MVDYTLHCGDCVDYMATMADNSVDLIAADGPYHRVKTESWDRQHKTERDFLAWLDTVLVQFARILKPNGSLYMFASPKMAARVEVLIGERFNVLNRITWQKPPYATKAEMFRKSDLRSFFPASEAIIFAEHFGADNIAKGEAGYTAKCDELRGFVFEPLRAYLDGERKRAGVKIAEIRDAMGFSGNMPYHWFAPGLAQGKVSQWQLPTEDHYHKMRDCLSRLNHGGQYLQRPYEDLRTEYEELRRPFSVSADVPYTDVWTFATVQAYAGKHPCEKPLSMMEHLILASSRVGAVVFDPFMGSGSTGVAAIKHGRRFIGCDLSERWVKRTEQRILMEAQTVQPSLLEVA